MTGVTWQGAIDRGANDQTPRYISIL